MQLFNSNHPVINSRNSHDPVVAHENFVSEKVSSAVVNSIAEHHITPLVEPVNSVAEHHVTPVAGQGNLVVY